MADDLLTQYRSNRQSDADFWNQTLANIGGLLASIPEQRARAEDLKLRREQQREEAGYRSRVLGFKEQELQDVQRARQQATQMQQAVSAIMAKSMVKGAKGGYVLDRKTLLANAAQQGIPPEALLPHIEVLDKIDASVEKSEKERRGHVADLLDGLIESGGSRDAAMLAISYGQKNGWLTEDEVLPLYERLVSDQDILGTAKQMRASLRGTQAGEAFTLKEGETRFVDGRPIASVPKTPEGLKLSATAIEKIAGIDASRALLANLQKNKNDEWLGPVAGRVSAGKIMTPGVKVPDDLARFSADTATLENSVIKAITGSQMSEAEAKRIMRQVPRMTDKPNVWQANYQATLDNLKMLKRRTIELSGGTMPPEAPPVVAQPPPPQAGGSLTFTSQEVQELANASGSTYAQVKAALEAQKHRVVQ